MGETFAQAPDSEVARFTHLLGTCQRQVFLYALGLLHNAADAEEVLQETNIVLWQKFHQYQPGTGFVRWACRIAYFQVLKLRARRPAEERLFSDEFIDVVAAEWDATLDDSDNRREALDGCLERLRPPDRELLLRRYQPGATTRSVAEKLGRNIQATRRRLRHLRERLLACIRRSLAAEERHGSA